MQGYFFGRIGPVLRAILLLAALSMIEGSWLTDIIGLAAAAAIFAYQKKIVTPRTLAKGSD